MMRDFRFHAGARHAPSTGDLPFSEAQSASVILPELAKTLPQGLLLLVPERTINDLLRAVLFPEMASLRGHSIADHAAITRRLLGAPFTEVHQYIDAAVETLGPDHRAVLHDLITSPGGVAEAFAGSASHGRREAAAAILGHYLPDSTTPDGIRLLGFRMHLGDLLQGLIWASLAWRLWSSARRWRRALAIDALCRRAREAAGGSRWAESAKAYEAAACLAPASAEINFNLAHTHRLAGNLPAARAAYLRAAERFGRADVAWNGIEASGRGAALLLAAMGPDGRDERLVREARVAFIAGCRRAAHPGGFRERLASVCSRAAGMVEPVAPLTAALLQVPARIYHPRRAAGNALLAAACEALLN